MPNFKVVVLQHGYPSVRQEEQIITAAGGQFVDGDRLASDADALVECETADAILVRWQRITPELIRRFARCRILVRYGIGYDNVDVPAATEANIMVGHIPTYSLDEVSTHTVALLMACIRNIVLKHKKMEYGAWDFNPQERLYRTAGRTLGLVGFGNIGRAVARKMSGWGMRLLATDPFVEPEVAREFNVQLVDLEELLRTSDYVSLHVPLLPETHHLIGERQLAMLKPGAILINTARGPVVDLAALTAALESGPLGKAGLDVFEYEPLPPESPLRRHPRVVLSDHVAWYSGRVAAGSPGHRRSRSRPRLHRWIAFGDCQSRGAGAPGST